MIDIAVDQKINDIIFQDFDFVLYDELNEIMQNLSIRLKFFLGEWYLDITQGLPYYQIIFSKNANLIQVESLIKNEILNTRGITEIIDFQSDYEPRGRIFSVKFTAKSISGEPIYKEMELRV